LEALGCVVTSVSIYRTYASADWAEKAPPTDWESADLLVFTSPSSIDFFTEKHPIPRSVSIAAIGAFTEQRLKQEGLESVLLVPGGDLKRAPELLKQNPMI
jgi:uroporphyrinogen-III synthase